MSLVNEMKQLSQQIIEDNDARLARLKDLTDEVQTLLEQYEAERKELETLLQEALKTAFIEREKQVDEFLARWYAIHQELNRIWQDTLSALD